MKAREALLARLRAQKLDPVPLPPLSGDWIRFADPQERFRVALGEAAGKVVSVGIGSSLAEVVAGLDPMRGAVCCSFAAMLPGNREPPREPHAYHDVDVVIAPAQFGVAENGAVWIDGAAVPVRAALFLAQHLVLLLPQGEIVDNMHQAYERIGAKVAESAFGCFMSGPSKTADIEQSLVVGAHGPRSLTIVEY
ncbi:MAG TPA: LUD domain-containing protein [Polyangiaceae bacterium]|nr:LUD domain-containing protein [Polyangiaceae bacterium]